MKDHKLLIDIGSTKADWVYLQQLKVDTYQTMGYNPLTHEEEDLRMSIDKVKNRFGINYPLSIYYYGSGISTKTTPFVFEVFSNSFTEAQIHITNDLLGAARAVCQRNPGIVCISGTGSNACVYDGEKIIDKINSLGFIMGDEGSGNHLGKRLIQDYFYDLLPSHITKKFENSYPDFNKNDFLESLYHEDMPNAYLASFTKFLGKNKQDAYLQALLASCFKQFVQLHVLPLATKYNLPIYMIGSIAHHFKSEWLSALSEYGLGIGRFIQKPMAGLIEYHQRY